MPPGKKAIFEELSFGGKSFQADPADFFQGADPVASEDESEDFGDEAVEFLAGPQVGEIVALGAGSEVTVTGAFADGAGFVHLRAGGASAAFVLSVGAAFGADQAAGGEDDVGRFGCTGHESLLG